MSITNTPHYICLSHYLVYNLQWQTSTSAAKALSLTCGSMVQTLSVCKVRPAPALSVSDIPGSDSMCNYNEMRDSNKLDDIMLDWQEHLNIYHIITNKHLFFVILVDFKISSKIMAPSHENYNNN